MKALRLSVANASIFGWFYSLFKMRPWLTRVKTRLSYKKNSAKNLIFDSTSSNSTSIHQFYYSASTRLRLQSFGIRLNIFESRVRTPLHQNLLSGIPIPNVFAIKYVILLQVTHPLLSGFSVMILKLVDLIRDLVIIKFYKIGW